MTDVTYETIWDQLARENARDAILAGADEEKWETTGRSNARRVLAHCAPDSVVLSIGCGAGRMEKYVAPEVKQVHAIDISSHMLKLAGERLAGQDNCFFYHVKPGEYLMLFPEAMFDAAYSYLVLQHVKREHAYWYLVDLHRVLKPGGRVSLQFPNLLSDLYTESFLVQAVPERCSLARVRCYTIAEARHLCHMAGFAVTAIDWFPEWTGPEHEATSREMFLSLRKA